MVKNVNVLLNNIYFIYQLMIFDIQMLIKYFTIGQFGNRHSENWRSCVINP